MKFRLFFIVFQGLIWWVKTTQLVYAQRPPEISGGFKGKASSGLIKGFLHDEISEQPVEFASLALFRLPKDSLISGTLSGPSGEFVFENLKPGKYKLVITFMGYKKLTRDSIRLKPGEELNLGLIKLVPHSKNLKEVTVSGEKEVFVQNIEKKVFNVEKSMVSAGGSATDVLQQVPTVGVDIDGKISLRGSENVTILIDGRPSGMSGSGRQGTLGGIPASAIESVEIISNPGAKYDPDGMSGIINIVLKKNKTIGFNGGTTLAAGTRNKYNASGNINFRNNKVNVFAGYNFRYNERYGYGSLDRTTIYGDSTIYLDQFSYSNSVSRSHNIRLGNDFFLNKASTLGWNISVNADNRGDEESILNNFSDSRLLKTDANIRSISNPSENQSADGGIYFKKNFSKSGTLLNAESNLSVNKGEQRFLNIQNNTLVNYRDTNGYATTQRNNNLSDFIINTNFLDFETTTAKYSKFETGTKNINRQIKNSFYAETFSKSDDSYKPDSLLNNEFIYTEHIFAGYINYAQSLRQWTLKGGIRAEQALTRSEVINTAMVHNNDYFNLFPSVFINRKLGEKQEVQLSYSRRINRPGTQQLVPFTDYSNPQIIRTGNPKLNPEYVHSMELNYLTGKSKFNYSVTLYYRRTNGLIFRNISVVSPVQSMVTFVNLGSSDNMGVETITRMEPVKWFNATVNLNGFQTVINGSNQDGEINSNLLSWNIKVIANFVLSEGWTAQMSGNYNAPRLIGQGQILPNNSIDAAVRKDVLNGRGSIMINCSDVFNQLYFGIKTSGSDFAQQVKRKRETRIANVSFTYRFGNNEQPLKRRTRNESEYKTDDGF